MDPWDLAGSIREHQSVMAWYGERNIPVELNEAHHWGMRDAPDVVFVASAYFAAYNAKAFGVKDYIIQMMFNSPPGTSDAMDLAKMAAALALSSELEDDNFHIWRQTRTGLAQLSFGRLMLHEHIWLPVFMFRWRSNRILFILSVILKRTTRRQLKMLLTLAEWPGVLLKMLWQGNLICFRILQSSSAKMN